MEECVYINIVIAIQKKESLVRRPKSYLSRLFLYAEICIFFGVYFFGVDGILTLHSLQNDNVKLENEITQLQSEISSLQRDITAWESDPFFKEKVARELLQMARQSEEIFFIK